MTRESQLPRCGDPDANACPDSIMLFDPISKLRASSWVRVVITLLAGIGIFAGASTGGRFATSLLDKSLSRWPRTAWEAKGYEIGRASCRERVTMRVGAGTR